MVTVLRAHGLRVVIHANDHRPAHVHVFGDGEAKIDLLGGGAPGLVWADGMTHGEVRRAMRLAPLRPIGSLAQRVLVSAQSHRRLSQKLSPLMRSICESASCRFSAL